MAGVWLLVYKHIFKLYYINLCCLVTEIIQQLGVSDKNTTELQQSNNNISQWCQQFYCIGGSTSSLACLALISSHPYPLIPLHIELKIHISVKPKIEIDNIDHMPM